LTTEPVIRLARTIARSAAEGPGHRFVVWVQGCSIRCHGCFNPHLWAAGGGRLVTPGDLCDQVGPDVEGVTLLGGEPFEQARALAAFAARVRRRGLSVMTFTGYDRCDLAQVDGAADLLQHTDLLVDGPYRADLLDLRRPWAGSANQRFHFLTERYRHLEQRLSDLPDRLELRVGPDGSMSVNGWATTDQLDTLLADGWSKPPRS
jgi:anaerobic ribonucleoside-triphosphate reductase activating protein